MNDLAATSDMSADARAALEEGEKRLRQICDPEAVNQLCFEDQQRRIEQLGGREACENAYLFGHTPTPDEQRKMANDSSL